jgi:DNA-binding NarL/FixJ family response regulator
MKHTPRPVKLVIADDHELVREGLSAVLVKEPGVELLGVASDGRQLVAMVKQFSPAVVLTDLKMPLMDGIEATRQIRAESPGTEVIALSMFDDQSLILDILDAGAIGYLLKNAPRSEIVEAIRCAAMNEQYYSREISLKLAQYVSHTRARQQSKVDFTEKELQVIRYICREFTSEEIGKQMYHSKRTIDDYRAAILHKMNVKGVAGIVVYAIQHGLFSLENTKQ